MRKKTKVIEAKIANSFGMPVVVRKNSCDIYCGYVGVPKSHPFYGTAATDSVVKRVKVHGGVSYSAGNLPWLLAQDFPGFWWFGFDCATEDDAILSIENGSGCVYRDEHYAQDQALLLARRLAGLYAEMN